MNFSRILFDLDGTLTDSKEGIFNAIVYALNQYGITVTDRSKLNPFLGPPLKNSFMKIFGFDEKKANEALSLYREYFAEKGIFENKPYDGIAELLLSLKNKNKVVILATSKPLPYAKRILDRFELTKYFSFIFGSELDGTRADKEDVIKYALENCDIQDLSKAVMVGDRSYDILGAKKADIASIGVLYGYGEEDELNEADYLANSVDELKTLLI